MNRYLSGISIDIQVELIETLLSLVPQTASFPFNSSSIASKAEASKARK